MCMEWPIAPGAIPTEVFRNGSDIDYQHLRKSRSADYALFVNYLPNQPLAIVEAKKFSESDEKGLQQAIAYAQACGSFFAYSSSGHGFIEHDFFTGNRRTLKLNEFPSYKELWERYVAGKNLSPSQQKIISTSYATTTREPRYYQANAINAVVEAFSKDKKRSMLVMATGTGKTYTAFQIVSRLISSGKVRHVLYLADRNILVDQAKNGDFSAFGGKATKIRNHKFDPAYQIHFALYQQLIETTANGDIIEHFKKVKPTFFDLIVIDECHRGSADADSVWHKILDYFSSAFHLGLTATPRETKAVSTIDYFGEPVYTYSLKEGIADGFLAPYELLRCQLNLDANGFSPKQTKTFQERGMLTDEHGNEVPEENFYSREDFDRAIIIRDRTKAVAKRIADCLREHDCFSKTIVFCVNTDHAARLRDAISNEFHDIVKDYPNFVMRITGDDVEGKKAVDAFCDPKKKEPTIATTSQLLSTGVDCRTCRFVVLDKNIGSMIEFKQIIGRGTRIAENLGKTHFSILDFRGNAQKFSDPAFDGPPVKILEVNPDGDTPGGDVPVEPPPAIGEETQAPQPPPLNPFDPPESPKKIYIGENEVSVYVQAETVSFVDPRTGKPVTEDLISYTRKNMKATYASLKNFLAAWNRTPNHRKLLDELSEHGVFVECLRDKFKKSKYGKNADDIDDFDIICHYAFDAKNIKSKSERAEAVKNSHFLKNYSELARRVLEALIKKYAKDGLVDFGNTEVFYTDPIRDLGSPRKILQAFGGRENFEQAALELSEKIYS